MNFSSSTTFFLLLCGHAVADFAFQTEWMATYKNRNIRPKQDVGHDHCATIVWPYLLSAHALHHGLMVFLVTQRLTLALAETAVHWCSDYAKCEGWYGFHADQLVHIGSKIAWSVLIAVQVV